MESGKRHIIVGTGGWEHEVFDRCFYPEANASPAAKLEFFSRYFGGVEIRATFWDDRLDARDAEQWASPIPREREFLFIPKLHASATHRRVLLPQVVRSTREILDTLRARQRLGALLVQFPYAFSNTSAHRYYLARIAEAFAGYPLHVEVRHESWNTPDIVQFFGEHGCGPVSADVPRVRQLMPVITRTSGHQAYLRLHGRNEKGWLLNTYDYRYDYLYNSKELNEIRRRVQALSPADGRTLVMWNNTPGGKALANAFQLLGLLQDGGEVMIPEATRRAFPHLERIARSSAQVSLFEGATYRQAM